MMPEGLGWKEKCRKKAEDEVCRSGGMQEEVRKTLILSSSE